MVNDFDTAPVNFVDYNKETLEIIPLFKIHRFGSSVKKSLITPIIETSVSNIETDVAVGRIKITTKGDIIKKKIINSYSKKNYALEYAPDLIVFEITSYQLKYPLRCLFEMEDDYFVIQSEILDIIGTGLTEDEAEISFAEEFNFLFDKLNSLDNSQLTEHNQLIKLNLNNLIEKVEK